MTTLAFTWVFLGRNNHWIVGCTKNKDARKATTGAVGTAVAVADGDIASFTGSVVDRLSQHRELLGGVDLKQDRIPSGNHEPEMRQQSIKGSRKTGRVGLVQCNER